MAMESLRWRTPHEALTGTTPDISVIYWFCFYDQVYVKRDEPTARGRFPSESDEVAGDLSVSQNMLDTR